MSEFFNKLSLGGDLTFYIGDTNIHRNLKGYRIVTNEATVFDTITDNKGRDLMSLMNITGSNSISENKVLNANNRVIDTIKLVSGSIIVLR